MIWLLFLGAIIVLFGMVVFRGAPYVPSHKKYIGLVFDNLVKLKPDDVVVDIGSGDGIVLRQVARRGASAVGIELNPILVLVSKLLSYRTKQIKTIFGDFWLKKLPENTTIVYVFGESRDIDKIGRYVQKESNRLNRQITFVSYGFKVSDMKIQASGYGYNVYHVTPLLNDQT